MNLSVPASEIEARIRDEAERKIAAVHTLKKIHNEIIEEREAFLTRDSERRRQLGDALAQAKKAGFSDAELKDWRVDPVGSSRKPRARRAPSKTRDEDPVSGKSAQGSDTTPAGESEKGSAEQVSEATA